MSDFVLPEEAMLCILTRLPVKSLLRFKSVCKGWRELFGTHKFMKMHYDQFSSSPHNQKFIVYSHNTDDVYDEKLYFVSIDSGAVKPTNVDLPYDGVGDEDAGPKCFVGCCYSLICIGLSHGYALWNPALSLFKFVFTPSFFHRNRSCGFVYDAEGDDFKIVSILLTAENMPLRGEVFSNKSDSWEIIEVGLQFRALSTKCNAILNGNAYWVAADVVGDRGVQSALGLVRFDATKMEFEMVPISAIEMDNRRNAHLQVVDWKGCLGVLVFTITRNGQNFLLKSVDVWVKTNEGEMVWTKIHRFEARGMQMRVVMRRFLQCCKSGKVVEYVDGKLFVADSETGLVTCVEISDVAVPFYSDMCGYCEGLAYVGGMKPRLDSKQESDPYEVQFRENVDDFFNDLRMHGVI